MNTSVPQAMQIISGSLVSILLHNVIDKHDHMLIILSLVAFRLISYILINGSPEIFRLIFHTCMLFENAFKMGILNGCGSTEN